MPKKSQLIVYSLEFCPHCEILKDFLRKGKHAFSERDLSSAESLTELRVNGVFVNEAPVLQMGEEFYTTDNLFPSGTFDEKHVSSLLKGE